MIISSKMLKDVGIEMPKGTETSSSIHAKARMIECITYNPF